MSSTSQRVVIALYNMGGPLKTANVRDFLMSLFSDNDLLGLPFPGLLQKFVANKIVTKRISEVEHRYNLIGGGSPQLEITQQLCEKIKKQLTANPIASIEIVDVVPLMRYTAPNATDVLALAQKHNANEVWLYSQYPHCSRATTGSSLRDIGMTLSKNALTQEKLTIRSFLPTAFVPAFVDLWAKRIGAHWKKMGGQKHLLVSAHSLPVGYIAQGDPYSDQIIRFALEVLRRVGLSQNIDWTMCWQSAVGPAKWLRPYTPDALKDLRARGVENILVWPVSFVSDHIETTYELDMEYGDVAKELGFKAYERVANLNADADYVDFSTSLITQAATELAASRKTNLLRCLYTEPVGEGCNLQPGGCLCARYFKAGIQEKQTGVPWNV